jgi:methyl-accepting chemotaxis protein
MSTTPNTNPSSTPSVTPDLSFAQKLAKEATVDWTTLAKAIENSYRISVEINKTFGQGQERLSELMGAVSDAVPRITRLGGSITDVQTTMKGIAEASRRNVIANTEDVEKLYAATQVVGGSAEELSNAFLDVGVGIEQVGKQLENSVDYVRSIGGNTKAVMGDVSKNMDQMNRYQFAGGVQGLTKMAAQASMLRFDMNQTFQLADKVLDPENAIEVASAFQRLGVSAGNLADPFQLMNQSINDPSGLQDSLAKVAKQYTYFDEQTKTFKINPQGVLTLREMEKQTGVSAKEMAKMGLAAAELDERISAINQAGLSIGSEEDKQYLANIATMQDGKYMVKLEDGTKKELAELSQPEFDKLIEQQKTGPKTLEEIAFAQLDIDKATLAAVGGLRDAFAYGITSPKQVTKGIAGAQRAAKTVLGETSDAIKAKDFRDLSEGVLTTLGNVAKDLKDGNKPLTDVLSNGLNGLGSTLDASQKRFTEVLREVGDKIAAKLTPQTVGERVLKSGVEKINEAYAPKTASSSPLSSSVGNKMETLQNGQNTVTTQTTKGNVDVGGKIEVDVKVPNGVSMEQIKQILDSTFNDSRFKDYIIRLMPDGESKEPVSKTY